VSGGTASSEFEPQLPLAQNRIVRGRKLPFFGGIGCQAGEILAWAVIFNAFIDDVACAIDSHANRDPDMAVDRFAGLARNVGDYFMEHGR
jgi:hypothetical protein